MEQDGKTYLKAENPAFPDLHPVEELQIQGVLVTLLRDRFQSNWVSPRLPNFCNEAELKDYGTGYNPQPEFIEAS